MIEIGFGAVCIMLGILSLHYPARGRKQLSLESFFSIESIAPFAPLPRKGTETLSYGASAYPVVQAFAPLPRKGTETAPSKRTGQSITAFRSITPQGDGNVAGCEGLLLLFLTVIFRSITPQGDGNR